MVYRHKGLKVEQLAFKQAKEILNGSVVQTVALAAHFGLESSERQSGCFVGSKNKLSKRGPAYVRAALHMAAVAAVIPQAKQPAGNPVLLAYYEQKCTEKPPQVALCAGMHKISNIIFAVLRDQKPFELRLPEQHARRLGLIIAA